MEEKNSSFISREKQEAIEELFGKLGMENSREKAQAVYNDPKMQELHRRATERKEYEELREKNTSKYKVADSRIRRIMRYYLKAEKTPEDIAYNEKLTAEVNTPNGCQAFVNRLTKQLLEVDYTSLVKSSTTEMVEKYLEDPTLAWLMFAAKDLTNPEPSTSLFTIDPALKEQLNSNLTKIQIGGNYTNAADFMSSDYWPYIFSMTGNQKSLIVDNKISGIQNLVAKSFTSGNAELGNSLINITQNVNVLGTTDNFLEWEEMGKRGMLDRGTELSIDGKAKNADEVAQYLHDNGIGAIDNVKAAALSNEKQAEITAKLGTFALDASTLNERDNVMAFLDEMEASQKRLRWGNGSPEFGNLMDAVREYREAAAAMGGAYSHNAPEMVAKLSAISERADIYLKKKEGVSLNKNGRERFALVTNLKALAENAYGKKYHDMIEYHSALKELGINSTTVPELKAKMEEPGAKKIHEDASKYVRAVNNVTMKAVTDQYGSEKGYNFTGVERMFHYYLDYSGTPEANKHNDEFMESIKSPEGRQKLTNHIVKTLLETPDEFFFAETIQEGAKRYLENPALAEIAFVACDIINQANAFPIDDNLRKELEKKLVFYQEASWYKDAANLMARDDWGLLDAKTDVTTAGMFNAVTMRKGGKNDPYKVIPNEGIKIRNEYGQVVVSLAQNLPGALEIARIMKENGDLFKPGTEYMIDGSPAKLTEVFDKIRDNEEKGLDPREGLTSTVNEKQLSDLKNSLATVDTGDFYIKPYVSANKAPEVHAAEEAKQEEPEIVISKPTTKAYVRSEAPKPQASAAEMPKLKHTEISSADQTKYENGIKQMYERRETLPDGVYKDLLGMAIEARQRIHACISIGETYPELKQDIKTMIAERSLARDHENGGQLEKLFNGEQEDYRQSHPNFSKAKEFAEKTNFGPALAKMQKLTEPAINPADNKLHYDKRFVPLLRTLVFDGADRIMPDIKRGMQLEQEKKDDMNKARNAAAERAKAQQKQNGGRGIGG